MKTIRPSNLSRTLALLPPAVVLVSQHASAAFNGFLKYDTLPGDSLDAKHANWIDITGITCGVSKASGTENAKASDFIIIKKLDRSSPQLFLNGLTGATAPTVTLELFSATNATIFYRITLENVIVKKIDSTGTTTGTDTRPVELISLAFQKIKLEYFYQDPKTGSTVGLPAVTWNFTTNAP